jgi:hypothetical protein
MVLQNSRTGRSYELILEGAGTAWQGTWSARASDGSMIDAPRGTARGAEASQVFEMATREIERADTDVIGVDWEFDEPLPPWLAE